MNSWERFHEKLLPDKKAFNSELYLENTTEKTIHMLKKYSKN